MLMKLGNNYTKLLQNTPISTCNEMPKLAKYENICNI